MFHGTRPGWIEVIAGVMFSGKSEELIRRVRRAVIARKQVQVFKSHLDARYAGLYNVSTHDGITVEAEPVDSAAEIVQRIRPATEVVAVDEAQFLDEAIVDVANTLADRGVRVILAGTDVDFRGLPFGPMPTLMCVAELVDKFQAICVVCGGPAGARGGSAWYRSAHRHRQTIRRERAAARRRPRPRRAALQGDGRRRGARGPECDRPSRGAAPSRRAARRGESPGRPARRQR